MSRRRDLSDSAPRESTSESGFTTNLMELAEENRKKFNADGSARLFPGATTVCHLLNDGRHDAIYNAIIENCFIDIGGGLIDRYVRLPESSLHMTILDVIVYSECPDSEETTRKRQADMKRFRKAFMSVKSNLEAYLPVRMTIELDPKRAPELGHTLTVPLMPLDQQEANKIVAIREILSEAFGMPVAASDYAFHITGYYALRSLSEEQFTTICQDWSEVIRAIYKSVPIVEIDRIELCEFEDMCHFEIKEAAEVRVKD